MITLYNTNNLPTWYLAHNAINVFHYGSVYSGTISTGQPFLLIFDNLQSLLIRLALFGITPE